ncbi:MAG: N-acetylmuramoyl-L-alanine amidase family protein [Oscillospiraceae bacterium]|nr:N-acetylmuramoyl-L-alanine amidase family protein [Oscillospiraceae bacterium]
MKEYANYSYAGNTGATSTSDQIGVAKGTYYLKVSRDYYSSVQYALKVNYKSASNWETEFNDSFYTANSLSINTEKNGSLMNSGDVDYYVFTVSQNGYYTLSFKHDYVDRDWTYWRATIYDSDFEALKTISYRGNDLTENVSEKINLESGKYYIKIQRDYYASVKYTLKVNSLKQGWQKVNNVWYYYDSTGNALTGWNKVGGSWYYMNSSGAMQTGWVKVGGTWYYLNSSGAMLTGWQKIGSTWYYLGASGAMQTGWVKVGPSWYYMNSSGAMQTGWVKSGATWYYLTDSGAMATGWVKVGGSWYYMNASGAMQTGWIKQGNTWYYLNSSGAMVTGTQTIGGKTYRFDSSGKWIA